MKWTKALAGLAGLGLAACVPSGPVGPDLNTPLHSSMDGEAPRYGQVMSSVAFMDTQAAPLIESIKINKRCRMPRASRDAKIVYVYSYAGGTNSPLAHAYKSPFETGRERHGRTDIIVTETSKPIFLLLESYDSVLWTLQVAPGVDIDGVAVLSYEGSSLANGPGNKRVGFLGFRGVENNKCFQRGGEPVAVDLSVARAKENNYIADQSDREKWGAEYRELIDWQRRYVLQLIGGQIDEQIYRTSVGPFNAVLIGPVPDAPFAGQAVTKLQVPDNLNVAWGQYEQAMQALDAIALRELEDLQ